MDDFEWIFKSDIREKKRIGSGIFSRVSTRKGGTNQALKTPYLYMSNKDKKKLNGREVVYNMKDIISLDEFEKKDDEMKRKLLQTWREHNSIDDIAMEMNVDAEVVTGLFSEFNIKLVRGRRYRPMNGSINIDSGFNETISRGISFEEFRKYDIKTQCEIYYRLLVMYNRSVKKVCYDYFKIPLIRYFANIKSRKTFKDIESKYKGKDIIDEQDDSYDNVKIVDDKHDEIELPIESINEQEQVSNVEQHTITKDLIINDKSNTDTNLDVAISGLQFKIDGVQKRETLARRLQFIVDELLSDDADELLVAKVSIGNLE